MIPTAGSSLEWFPPVAASTHALLSLSMVNKQHCNRIGVSLLYVCGSASYNNVACSLSLLRFNYQNAWIFFMILAL